MKKWTIDPAHSQIAFKARHLMISTVRGVFNKFEGGITAKDDTLSDGIINFSANIDSIDTGHTDRNGHLLSADFFDAESFPKMSFESTSVKRINDNLDIIGNLTIRGITKLVQLQAKINGSNTDMYGKKVTGFELNGKINRQDFGVKWNAILETGGLLIGDDIEIEAFIEAQEV